MLQNLTRVLLRDRSALAGSDADSNTIESLVCELNEHAIALIMSFMRSKIELAAQKYIALVKKGSHAVHCKILAR